MKINSKNSFYIKRFTLLELLLVITLIAILAALLLPMLNSARVNAKRANDINNMRQIYIAIQSYCMDNCDFFPYIESIAKDTGNCSKTLWLLLPYLNYNTKVLLPDVDPLDGNLIYNTIKGDTPEVAPEVGFAYSPLYKEDEDSPAKVIHLGLEIMDDKPVMATYSDKYNNLIYVRFSGSIN